MSNAPDPQQAQDALLRRANNLIERTLAATERSEERIARTNAGLAEAD